MFALTIWRCGYRLFRAAMARVASHLSIVPKGIHFERIGVNRLDHLEHRSCDCLFVDGVAREVAHGVAKGTLDTQATASHEHSPGKFLLLQNFQVLRIREHLTGSARRWTTGRRPLLGEKSQRAA
jgi:hypothetical protein